MSFPNVSNVALWFALALVLWALFSKLYQAYASPLRDVQGPWLARFTRFWYARSVYSRQGHKINLDLHKKYGPIVRIAPNEYSIDDLEASKIIYRSRDPLVKTPRYAGWGLPNAEPSTFTTLDNAHHAARIRQVNSLYQNSALVNIEYQVDGATNEFVERLSEFAKEGKTIDMSDWLKYYAFDAVGSLSFGKPFGFLQKGTDIAGILETIHSYAFYGMVAGIYHEWHPTTYKLWQWLAPKERGGGIAHIMQFAGQTMDDWNQRLESEKAKEEEETDGGELLYTNQTGSLLAKVRRNPEGFKIEDIFYHMSTNVLAGGETTAASTANIVYYLIKNPRVLNKLRGELEEVLGKRERASKRISLKEAQNIPYLQAVIKESLRILPNGLHLPRVVPEGGLTLAGRFFPEDTMVGVNPWVAHANRSVYGEDADVFRPERWQEEESSIGENKMEQYFFTFGRGPRTCLGKNISLMEMNKLIPELVLRFDVEMAEKDAEWTVYNDWFVKQEGFRVKVSKRQKSNMLL